jgi:hypothetical protein
MSLVIWHLTFLTKPQPPPHGHRHISARQPIATEPIFYKTAATAACGHRHISARQLIATEHHDQPPAQPTLRLL